MGTKEKIMQRRELVLRKIRERREIVPRNRMESREIVARKRVEREARTRLQRRSRKSPERTFQTNLNQRNQPKFKIFLKSQSQKNHREIKGMGRGERQRE